MVGALEKKTTYLNNSLKKKKSLQNCTVSYGKYCTNGLINLGLAAMGALYNGRTLQWVQYIKVN